MANNIQWTEKYKPVSLDQCALDGFPKHIQTLLKSHASLTNPLNLLLVGPTGTGKTQIAGLLQDNKKLPVMRLHGFHVDMQKIVQINSNFITLKGRRQIVIDDVDQMTKNSQHLLCTYIEGGAPVSWIMTGTDTQKIIEPIKSRLIRIDLPAQTDRELGLKGVVQQCQKILRAEKIDHVTDNDIYEIANKKYPDIRQTINVLQTLYCSG